MKKMRSSAEAEPTVAKTSETAPRKARSGWFAVGGLALVMGLAVLGVFGWTAWKHHQFEKERTETPPHVVPDLKLKLLWSPAGTFTMGTEDEAQWLKSFKPGSGFWRIEFVLSSPGSEGGISIWVGHVVMG